MKKKTLIIGIILILTVLVGGFFVVQKKTKVPVNQIQDQKGDSQVDQQKDLEIESVKDLIDGEYQFEDVDTKSWQTYKNKEMGFEVKMPKNWYAEKWNEGICLRENGVKYYFESNSPGECAIYINFSDRYSSQRTNFREHIAGLKESYPGTKVMSFNIGGADAVVTDGFFGLSADFFRNSEAWNISFSLLKSAYPSAVRVYPIVLKTFKFTDNL